MITTVVDIGRVGTLKKKNRPIKRIFVESIALHNGIKYMSKLIT